MMEKIRSAANNIFVKIIFGIIMLAFVFTGVGGFIGFGSNSAKDERLYVAKIDGEGINRAAFEQEFRLAIQNAGEIGNDSSLQKIIRQSILTSQIDDYISYKLADSLHLQISDQQVKNIIRQQSVFFENNKFNNQLYLKILAANNYTPDIYANIMRNAMKKQQVLEALILSDFALPTDSDISSLINQKRTVYYTDYNLSNIEGNFTVSNEDIEKYYQEHKDKYSHPERLKIKYVINSFPEIEKDVKITDNEIKEYYSQKKEGTFEPEMQLYSVLTFKTSTSANKQYQTMVKLNDKKRLAIKMDSLGWFTINQQLPELLQKQTLVKIGSITKPIEQAGKYYIVRLDKIVPAKKLPLNDEVRATIISELHKSKTEEIFNQQQKRMDSAAKLGSIDEIAKAANLKVYESTWTTKNEILSIGRFPAIKDLIFSDEMVKDGKPTYMVSNIIHVPEYNSNFILQVTDYENAGTLPFDEVKDKIKDTLIAEKKKAVFNKNLDQVLAQLKEKGSAEGIQFSQKITLSRQDKIEQFNDKDIDEIFAIQMNTNNQNYGIATQDNEKAKIFALVGVKNAEVSDISSSVLTELLRDDQYYLLEDLRSKAKIEIMPNIGL